MKPATSASLRLFRVKDAIEVVARRLAALPPSTEVDELRLKVDESRREADDWKLSPPNAEERERLMRRVLRLHVAAAKVERQIQGT
jgi:hypothetical protein